MVAKNTITVSFSEYTIKLVIDNMSIWEYSDLEFFIIERVYKGGRVLNDY